MRRGGAQTGEVGTSQGKHGGGEQHLSAIVWGGGVGILSCNKIHAL